MNETCAAGHSAGSDASILCGGSNDYWQYPFIYSFKSIVALAAANNRAIKKTITNWDKQAILMLSGSSDCICPPSGSIPIYNEFGSSSNTNASNICRYYGEITNGTHCHFADILAIDATCYNVEEAACSENEKDREILARDIQLGLVQEYVWKFLQASLIDKTQESYDNLYDEMKQQVGEDGYITLLDYNCTV